MHMRHRGNPQVGTRGQQAQAESSDQILQTPGIKGSQEDPTPEKQGI